MDLGAALSRKYGPLPGVAWAGLAAGALALFVLLRGRSGSASKPAGVAAAQAPAGPDYSLGFDQGRASASNQPAQPASAQVKLQSIWGSSGATVWIFGTPADTSIVATPPSGSVWDAAGSPVQGGSHSANGVTSSSWVPIKYAGQVAYVWGPEAVPASATTTSGGGGMGGPGGQRRPGSRSSRLMHYAHPDVKAQPRFEHTIRARGGPGHLGEVHAAAAQVGIHPARLQLLNPHPRKYLRIK